MPSNPTAGFLQTLKSNAKKVFLQGLEPRLLLNMLNLRALDPLIELAFEEDIGIGDITTDATVPPTQTGIGTLIAKSEGIVAGLPIAERVFEKLDPTVVFQSLVDDGDSVVAGTPIAEVQGSAKAILIGERTALNFLQRLSGIATLTAQFVKAVADYDAKIVDTRKTAAGWRAAQKYACPNRRRAKPSVRALRRCVNQGQPHRCRWWHPKCR